jgi:hypothetical protein
MSSGYPRPVPRIDLATWAAPAAVALRVSAVTTIGGCVGLWTRAKTVDQSERGNAERRALFVGLWPPTLWLMADTISGRRR